VSEFFGTDQPGGVYVSYVEETAAPMISDDETTPCCCGRGESIKSLKAPDAFKTLIDGASAIELALRRYTGINV
jgi:hypothetical protein